MTDNTARAQEDVAVTFSVTQNRLFTRKNDQIYAIVGHNPELALVTTVWFDRFDTQEDFLQVHNYVLALFRTGAYRLIFADLRFQATGYEPSTNWLRDEFMPALFSMGLEREALVLPETSMREEVREVASHTERIVEEAGDARIRTFTSIPEAKKWLLAGKPA